jgi:hypothetical protein
MKRLKEFGTGLGAAAISIASSTGLGRNGWKCAHSCDACGGACILSLIGIGAIGSISLLVQKIKQTKEPPKPASAAPSAEQTN